MENVLVLSLVVELGGHVDCVAANVLTASDECGFVSDVQEDAIR